jgi:HAD superfamily hydrolase (TIGR01450 family)
VPGSLASGPRVRRPAIGALRRAYHPGMAQPDQAVATAPATRLAGALDGVRAFILDADGVLVYRGQPIPGSPEALLELRRRGIAHRVVTNFSTAHRSTLAAGFSGQSGVPVRADEIITAASAAAGYTAQRHPRQRLLVLAAPDALREWDGQIVVTPAEAEAALGAGEGPVGAVVIGDAGEELSFGNLDVAFRQLRAGAEFVAMHRNLWWMTARGVTLDAGALVAGLEAALGRSAVICGKPSPVVFRQALAAVRADLRRAGRPRLRLHEVAMVGDDPRADLAPARRLGLRTILALSGKTDAEAAARSGVRADAIAGDLGEVVEALRG